MLQDAVLPDTARAPPNTPLALLHPRQCLTGRAGAWAHSPPPAVSMLVSKNHWKG